MYYLLIIRPMGDNFLKTTSGYIRDKILALARIKSCVIIYGTNVLRTIPTGNFIGMTSLQV